MRSNVVMSVVCSIIALTFVAGWSSTDAFAQSQSSSDPDWQQNVPVLTINGLTNRRLFEMAEQYANDTLQQDNIRGTQRVKIIVALIDSLARKAYQSSEPGDWNRARDIAAEFRRSNQSPRKILIAVQAALVEQLQIERWIRELELESADQGAREEALAAIGTSVTRLTELQNEARRLLNYRPSPREEAEWFSANELLTLRYNLEYQQATALLFKATLYGDDQSLNRDDTLTLADQQLDSMMKSVGPQQGIWWEAMARRIGVARTMRDFQKANLYLTNIPKATGPTHGKNLVKAESIRLLMDSRKLEAAVALAGRDAFASETPTLDLARVELFVAMSGKNTQDKTWQQRALDLTGNVEQTHGRYWGRLANLSVVGAATTTPTSVDGNLDLLIRVADEAQRKKRWPEALKALDIAYQKAVAAGQTEVAWKLGFRAASIDQNEGRFKNAAERFRQLTLNHSDRPQAHTASLMACWNLTRVMKQDPAAVDQYEASLEQLVNVWPESTSANQARLWLATVRRSQRNWPAAIGLLLDIEASSPLFGQAVSQLRQTLPAFLDSPTANVSDESKSNIKSALVVRLAPLLNIDQTQLPDNWSTTKTQIVLQLAELKLLHRTELPNDISPELKLLANSNTATPDTAIAQALQFLDGGQRFQLSDGQQQLQMDILYRGLLPEKQATNFAEQSNRFRTAVEMYRTEIDSLPKRQKRRWDVATVDTLIWSGETKSAIALQSNLAIQFPKDASVQIRLAELLTEIAKTESGQMAKALTQWRRVSSSSRKGSDHWFVAKYQIVRIMAEQGETDEALKRLKFLKAIPPGWSKSTIAPDFDELYRNLGGK